MKKRLVVIGAVLALLLTMAQVSGATAYWCSLLGCGAQYLCNSEQPPRSRGTCMFECYRGGYWELIWCPFPGGK